MFQPTAATVERARLSVDVAQVFTDNGQAIAQACAEASSNEVVIAVADPGGQFDGVYVKPLDQLYRTVMLLAPGGWSLVFSSGDSLPEIELRCRQMARYAEARYRLARRIASR